MSTELISSDISIPTPKDSDYQAYNKFWKDNLNIGIYNALLNGIALATIAEMHSISVMEVQKVVTHKHFLAKLQEYLTGIIFANNAAKIIASEDVFNKLWTKVKDNIDDIPAEICLKELTKLLPQKAGKIILNNPKNVKINSKSNSDLSDDFGYEGLPEEDVE